MKTNPLVISNYENCDIFTDIHNHVRPIKRGKSPHQKIDIVVATMMAIAHFLVPSKDKKVPPITDTQFTNFMKFYE